MDRFRRHSRRRSGQREALVEVTENIPGFDDDRTLLENLSADYVSDKCQVDARSCKLTHR